jgi:predicted dehydrogenase
MSGFDPDEPLRLAVLGAGNIGKVHIQSALGLADVDLLAVADAKEGNRSYADRVGVPAVYDDYEALLHTEPVDAVVVALPPFLHRDAVALAADRDRHVFVEKPFARSTDEAEEIRSLASHVHVGVDHTIRYLPEVKQVVSAYRTGGIGDVPFASISRVNFGAFERPPASEPLPGWHLDPGAAGGGVLVELGVHLLDVLEDTFGDMKVESAATDRQLATPVEDTATVTLRSGETGTRVALHAGSYQWENDDEFNFEFRLEGMTGTLSTSEFAPGNFYGTAAKGAARNVARRLRGEAPAYYAPTHYLQAHFAALRAFVDAVRADETPPVSGEDGVRTLELVEDAYEMASAEEEPLEARI